MPISPLLALLLAAPPPPGAAWSYDVTPGADLSELAVEATFSGGSRLEVDPESAPYVREVQRVDGDKTAPLPGRGPWELSGCARGCKVRYRFQLRAAAQQLGDPDEAAVFGSIIESSPGAWLLRPTGDPAPGARYRLRVRSREGVRFATGLPSTGDLDTYEGPAEYVAMSPYSALGNFKVATRSACTNEIQVVIAPARWSVSEANLLDWVTSGARAVCDYFGKFPVAGGLVLVVPGRGFGKTLGGGGATTLIGVPEEMDLQELREGWVLVHEMVHTALPALDRRHHWLEEGLATYLEPVVRARAGALEPEKVWGDLVDGLPKGDLRGDENGLDDAPRWGPTYWGGALFWLKLDLEIRRHTKNARSLRDALRAVGAQGGSVAQPWPVERLLAALDKGAGYPAAEPLYRAMGTRRMKSNLGALWKALGVSLDGERAVFDDRAPEASLRQAITAH
ncbi:MAG TPA: hypothetical protein VND93_25915 [Myxococcales bacterium]|nr:hypothetical protein [Myxococcales bacterium]